MADHPTNLQNEYDILKLKYQDLIQNPLFDQVQVLKAKLTNLQGSEEARLRYERIIKAFMKSLGKSAYCRLGVELKFLKKDYEVKRMTNCSVKEKE